MARARREVEFPVSLNGTPSPVHQQVFYTVLRAAHVRTHPGYGARRDHLPGFELIFCLGGRGFVRVAGVRHEVAPGDLAVINCHHPHEHGTGKSDPWEAYWLRVQGPQLERVCSLLSVERAPVIGGVDRGAAVAVYQRIFAAMRAGTNEAAPVLHAEVAALLALICRARPLPGDDGGVPEKLRPAMDRIRRHYFQPHNIADLAKRCGLSASHFSRLFRRAFGVSAIGLLRRERIEHAKRRLAETGDPVGWIAAQVGYADRFFFSKDFKRITGMSPRQFRRQQQCPR